MSNTTTASWGSSKVTWGTSKTHGLQDGASYLYGGGDRKAATSKLRLVVAANQGRNGWDLKDAATGKLVTQPAPATRYWMAPAPAPAKKTPGRDAKRAQLVEDTAPMAPATKAPAKKAPATKAPAKKVTEAQVAPEGHPGRTWFNLLQKAGVSQKSVAQAMGVNHTTVNRLVTGNGVPTARVTVMFAKAVTELGGPKTDAKKLWQEVADFELAQALKG